MLLDAGDADRTAFEQVFDVCVAGAGPAGITLARRLAAQGFRVALMEAGGFDYDPVSQDIYAGECGGHDYFPLDECRLRYFGGTSGHWEGKCRPLETRDFLPSGCNPMSGWAIRKADLDPYLEAAARIVDLDDPVVPPDIPLAQAEERFRHVQWHYSPPTRFGEKYRDEILASDRIALCLNANLVDLRLSDDHSRVVEARFRNYDPADPGFGVRARSFAICLGGIENARMLLNFRSQRPEGIGNARGLVGRYFSDHPTVFTADMLLTEAWPFEQQVFAPTEELLEKANVSNFGVFVEPQRRETPLSLPRALKATAECLTPGVTALVHRLRGFRPRCGWGGLEEFSLTHDPLNNPWARVAVSVEQRLNAESRIHLTDATDQFGLRRPRICWNLKDQDYETFRAAITAFGTHVAEQNIGRLRVRPWLLAEQPSLPCIGDGNGQVAGRHHMGTTRMCSSPRTGVVDANCRVHEVENLFVGGSSVFSTGGFTKPTFTIVQLALRLGDHMGEVLRAA
ncbi:GMC oxidoreductase [Amaricoccus solimangrovi]|uniref:GMC family oxidoreductase n=1 Tax=Amaricoccus solimangrovi TaxID=2589815 RepID=A0A501WMF0_9RHOB|nr:GMC oxidoreductase [Amaricoccus solimangrovi]TPE49364.1 GMC family oxidoreductase [Amaricoccus solimangrovi]